MYADNQLKIRLATVDDKPFIVLVTPRLVEFRPPPWRDTTQITATDTTVLIDALDKPQPGSAIYIAETNEGHPLGFIHLKTAVDYYTQQQHGHIADVVVASTAAGKGVGQALLRQGEEWARQQNYTWLTLNVFAQNQQAISLYERVGYQPDIMKYVKELY